jgi:integrase
VTYEGYLNKWILPRRGNYPFVRVNAGEVELWLRSLTLAGASCAKIRNLMSVLFNHGIRYEICHRNPIQLVRQSAKRKAVPVVLTPTEVQHLLSELTLRERTLVLVAFGTGLRMSELFALKWRDINFHSNESRVIRSIVLQVVGPCKTEALQNRFRWMGIWQMHYKNGVNTQSTERLMTGCSQVQPATGERHIGVSPSCEKSSVLPQPGSGSRSASAGIRFAIILHC